MNRRHGVSVLTLICATAILGIPVTAHAEPRPEPVTNAPLEQVRKEIRDLYREAASATDAYNLAGEEAKRQSDQIVTVARRIAEGQSRIDDLKNRAGAAARAQYRTGGLPPGAQLALSNSPERFLSGAGRLQQGHRATMDVISELQRSQLDLQQYASDASSHYRTLEANLRKKEAAKREVTEKIAAAKQLEDRLEAEEKARLLQLEREEEYREQRKWLNSGALKDTKGTATEAGRQAVAYAIKQIGKRYVWGAAGPDTFDCSGLTSQAWLAAGTKIPRTSQEQLRLLPKVAVKDMRPGDLIIYFKDASHVALYVGDGKMVHAPRPGRNITMAGAGSMPILAVVRPESG
ncbi:NlpC/P60 family protein [Streptomyces sp. NPDC006879]|uniref:C40 family peptidase n=1 Tax=Streptomyces sp. NPDC006879 TaxID=3364767 RepID=UPI00367C8800